MKISVSSYSFSQLFEDGRLNQFEAIAKAKEIGFDGIEFVDILPHDNSTKEDYATKLRDECQRLQLPITNYTFGADFLKGSNGDTDAEIERVKKQIDMAAVLGAVSVRHDASTGFTHEESTPEDFAKALPVLARACREVTAYAKTLGIRTMVENHGHFVQDSARVEQLIQAVDDDNFGWLVDMGNFLCVDEDPAAAVKRAAPYAFYAHAKDFHQKPRRQDNPGEGFFQTRAGNYLRATIVGHGDVPVTECLSLLKAAGYDDFIAIEFEGMEDPLTGLRIGLHNLKHYLDKA